MSAAVVRAVRDTDDRAEPDAHRDGATDTGHDSPADLATHPGPDSDPDVGAECGRGQRRALTGRVRRP